MNHTYLVFLTIGYFDLDTINGPLNLGGGVTIPRLGAEAFLSVPGDMRQKVVAVVDMSNMALEPFSQPFFTTMEARADPSPPPSPPTAPPTPVTLSISYSSYNASTNQLFVAGDGQDVEITAGSTLVLGYGFEQQQVQVSSVVGAGAVQVLGLVRTVYPGSSVSNVHPGYPGPQPGFDYTKYKGVLPYLERIK